VTEGLKKREKAKLFPAFSISLCFILGF